MISKISFVKLCEKKKWNGIYTEVYVELPFSELWRTAVVESTRKELEDYMQWSMIC